jgi:deoxyribonuclease V
MRRLELGQASLEGIRLLRWPRSVDDARALQEELRSRVKLTGGPRQVRRIAGADIAYDRTGLAFAAVVVMSFPEGRVIEFAHAAGFPHFPYVPGYLTFREGPFLLAALSRLPQLPDLCLFDGQGLAHPRRFGLACHMGVLLDMPSIGCAKSLLVGVYGEPGPKRGNWSPIRLEDEEVGAAVRTRTGAKPIFVSPGHRISTKEAVKLALATSHFRVPEPIRLAEQLVNRLKREHPPPVPPSSPPP